MKKIIVFMCATILLILATLNIPLTKTIVYAEQPEMYKYGQQEFFEILDVIIEESPKDYIYDYRVESFSFLVDDTDFSISEMTLLGNYFPNQNQNAKPKSGESEYITITELYGTGYSYDTSKPHYAMFIHTDDIKNDKNFKYKNDKLYYNYNGTDLKVPTFESYKKQLYKVIYSMYLYVYDSVESNEKVSILKSASVDSNPLYKAELQSLYGVIYGTTNSKKIEEFIKEYEDTELWHWFGSGSSLPLLSATVYQRQLAEYSEKLESGRYDNTDNIDSITNAHVVKKPSDAGIKSLREKNATGLSKALNAFEKEINVVTDVVIGFGLLICIGILILQFVRMTNLPANPIARRKCMVSIAISIASIVALGSVRLMVGLIMQIVLAK